ncbi:MAG: transglycosylase SLT domain-containing protein [Anaerolineae bacterium]
MPSAVALHTRTLPTVAATASATPTTAPRPTRTPFPEDELADALRDLARRGEFTEAIALATEVGASPSTLGPEAMAALAQAYASERRPEDAIAVLDALLAAYPDWVPAWGALGDLYVETGQSARAVEAYRRFADLAPEAGPYAQFKMALLLRDAGDHAGVIAELTAADLSVLPASSRAEALELLAQSYVETGAYDEALATYDAILAFSQYADYRSLLAYYKADVHVEAGHKEQALGELRSVARDRPEAYAAFLALERLIELDDEELTPLERARILYHAGAYSRAAEAADEALEDAGDVAAALYWKGRSYAALGRYAEAVTLFDRIIVDHAAHETVGDAWMAKAAAAEALGGQPAGIYHEFVRQYPDHVRAPEALWRAAVSWEHAGRWELAREYYLRLVAEYPADSRVTETQFRAALSAYATGAWDDAAEGWAALLEAAPLSEKPRVELWLGLARDRAGDPDAARAAWDAAADALPWSYHGLRARELGGATGNQSVAVGDVPAPLDADGWASLRTWAEDWWQPAEGELATVVGDHGLVRRAELVWAAGWHTWARETLDLVRVELKDEPPALVDLAQRAERLGMYDQAIAAAERLLRLARDAGQEPPAELWQLAYPSYYADLVWEASAGTRVDPLLFLALVRQESQFNPEAVSWAGATGLTQVMPSTGEWIAEKVGPDPFSRDLLTRPHVSVMQGVWFLDALLDMFDGDWIAALAGYNAGPTNVTRWTGGEPIGDHDLFYETIPMSEPKAYIRLIYEGYRIYQHVYGKAAPS